MREQQRYVRQTRTVDTHTHTHTIDTRRDPPEHSRCHHRAAETASVTRASGDTPPHSTTPHRCTVHTQTPSTLSHSVTLSQLLFILTHTTVPHVHPPHNTVYQHFPPSFTSKSVIVSLYHCSTLPTLHSFFSPPLPPSHFTMLSQAASVMPMSPIQSSADWFALTVDESFSSVSHLADSPSASPTAFSSLRGLAQRRHKQHKLASNDFLAPLTPHLYPRTPFCSPISSPHPLDVLSATLSSSQLTTTAGSLLSPAAAASAVSKRKHAYLPSQHQSSPTHQLTVHTSSPYSSSSSSLSPHSARSHSVPFLPFRYFDDASSPNSASLFPNHCTPFPSPVQSAWQRNAVLAPPSPLQMTRPSSPQPLSANQRSASISLSPPSLSSSAQLLDYSSSLFVPAALLSNQPPLSPAVVPLTPPSSPLPLSMLALPASSVLSHSLSAQCRLLSVPSLC